MPGARYHLLKMFRGPRFAKCATNAGYALPLSMAFISICFFITNYYKRRLSESEPMGGGDYVAWTHHAGIVPNRATYALT